MQWRALRGQILTWYCLCGTAIMAFAHVMQCCNVYVPTVRGAAACGKKISLDTFHLDELSRR